MLLGKVMRVSADIIQEKNADESYYDAQIQIDPKQLQQLGKNILYPGMPVQVMIITNRLSPWDYFIGPIKSSFQRAFKES